MRRRSFLASLPASAVLLRAQQSSTPESEYKLLTPEEVQDHLRKKNVLLLDVRTRQELEETGTWPGYVHIPITELEERLSELPKETLILTACKRGGRAAKAADILAKNGFKIVGRCGMDDWKAKGYKTVPPKS